jgi:hypothetical protein
MSNNVLRVRLCLPVTECLDGSPSPARHTSGRRVAQSSPAAATRGWSSRRRDVASPIRRPAARRIPSTVGRCTCREVAPICPRPVNVTRAGPGGTPGSKHKPANRLQIGCQLTVHELPSNGACQRPQGARRWPANDGPQQSNGRRSKGGPPEQRGVSESTAWEGQHSTESAVQAKQGYLGKRARATGKQGNDASGASRIHRNTRRASSTV